MGIHKKHATTFCGKPVCVAHVQCPKGAKTEAPGREICPSVVSEMFFSDLDESQKSILWCKKNADSHTIFLSFLE